MKNLPTAWLEASLSDVALINPRGTLPVNDEDYISFVPMSAVDEYSGRITSSVDRQYKEVVTGYTQFQDGDVLFAKITPSMENGKSAIAKDLTNGSGVGSTEFHVLRPTKAIEAEYLWWYIRQRSFREAARRVMSGAVGQQRVPVSWLKNHKIPLAPLNEQRRIIQKLNYLINRTSRAHVELTKIPRLVEAYRSSILSKAFDGSLTKEWRDVNVATTSNDASLPSGWTVRRLDEIGEIQSGIQVGKKYAATSTLVEVPYLRVANVQRGWLNLDEMRTVKVTTSERDRLLLRDRDILMNEGGDRDKLGRGWIWNEQIAGCIHQNHVFRIRLLDKNFPPEFISHFANEKGQEYFFEQGTQTTNLASISKKKLSALPVPCPPVEEANKIVETINSAFAWLDRIAADQAAAARLLPQLDAAILARAFRGELIPQDPSDQPASDLLDQIRKTQDDPSHMAQTSDSLEFGGSQPRRMKALKKGNSMRKNRKDDDVFGKPYLSDLIRRLGGTVRTVDLYIASELSLVDFYQQLSIEYDLGWLTDDNTMVKVV